MERTKTKSKETKKKGGGPRVRGTSNPKDARRCWFPGGFRRCALGPAQWEGSRLQEKKARSSTPPANGGGETAAVDGERAPPPQNTAWETAAITPERWKKNGKETPKPRPNKAPVPPGGETPHRCWGEEKTTVFLYRGKTGKPPPAKICKNWFGGNPETVLPGGGGEGEENNTKKQRKKPNQKRIPEGHVPLWNLAQQLRTPKGGLGGFSWENTGVGCPRVGAQS